MAARNFTNQQFTLERDVCTLFLRFTGGGAGQPTGLKGKGVASVTWSTVGIYTIVLSDKYPGLLMAAFNVIDTGTIDDWEVTLDTDLTTGNTVVINVFKGGTAADLPTTAKLLGRLDLSNTSQLPVGY